MEIDSAANRIASCRYAAATFDLEVKMSDSEQHRISLYFLDWDRGSRAESVEVLDADSGALLDSQAITNFDAGTSAGWAVSGHVRIRVTRTSGPNAVVSGVFFD